MIWKNGQIMEGKLEKYLPENDKGWIYEVIRVIETTPVFLPEHLERFRISAEKMGLKLVLSDTDIIKGFFEIIRINKTKEGNIRLQADLHDGSLTLGFIPHRYPGKTDYAAGVAVELVKLEREKPEIKTWNKIVRQTADQILKDRKVYEVILTSGDGFLLEGSRSNLFGLKKGILHTPTAENVLPGITRQKVLDLAAEHFIPVKETAIHREEIFSFESFFITGTSLGLLPVKRIGTTHFNCISTTCNILRTEYQNKVKESINYARKNLRF